jgi:hypothetical protein
VRVEQGEARAGVPEVEGHHLVPPPGVDEQHVEGIVPRHAGGDEAAGGLVLPDGVRRRLRREEGEPRRETGHRAPRQHRRQRSLIDRRQCDCSEEDALSSPPFSSSSLRLLLPWLRWIESGRQRSNTTRRFGIFWDGNGFAAPFGPFLAQIGSKQQTLGGISR